MNSLNSKKKDEVVGTGVREIMEEM